MKETSTYKLIKGVFSPQDAIHILMEMINNKINYHNLKVFSMKERFNEHSSHSDKRIEELKLLAKQLRKTLESVEEDNQLVEIDCTINLTVSKKKQRITKKSSKKDISL